jgi:hypothetical protein
MNFRKGIDLAWKSDDILINDKNMSKKIGFPFSIKL